MSVKSAEILLLKELHELYDDESGGGFFNKRVRLTGYLSFLMPALRLCQIEDRSSKRSSVTVDLSLADMSKLSINLNDIHSFEYSDILCQVIGEIKKGDEKEFPSTPIGSPPFYIAATIIRRVDGLDLPLFEQALLKRRAFLQ
mmetsp:Transcript_24720/g.33951  ORF Transcript_24720/g.33951 Transcript_24720/m.33951 type:complete len:143 (-) Transcript_24720:37-465(-)